MSNLMQRLEQTLVRYLEVSYLSERNLGEDSVATMRCAIATFTKYLGRDATLEDLNDSTVSQFFRWLDSSTAYAQATRYARQNDILAIWRAAYREKLVDRPGKLHKIQKWQPSPRAWTEEEVARVLAASQGVLGVLANGVRTADYFHAIFSVAYETGLTRADLWALRRDQIGPYGRIWTTARSGVRRLHGISEATSRLIDALPGDAPLSWPQSKPTFYSISNEIVELAGVRPGSLKDLRSAGATHLFDSDPAGIRKYLGHSTDQMWRHHVDSSQQTTPKMPPGVPPWEIPTSTGPVVMPMTPKDTIRIYARRAAEDVGLRTEHIDAVLIRAARMLDGRTPNEPAAAVRLLVINAMQQLTSSKSRSDTRPKAILNRAANAVAMGIH